MSAELQRPLKAKPFMQFVIIKYKKDTYQLDMLREIAQGITGGKYPTFKEWTSVKQKKIIDTRTSDEIIDDFINTI